MNVTKIIGVSAGGSHTMIIRSDGTLWGTGLNSSGQLGIGSLTSTRIPVKVEITGTKVVSAGGSHTLINANDNYYSCGDNTYGQLGLKDTVSRNIPSLVAGYIPFSVSAGNQFSLFVNTYIQNSNTQYVPNAAGKNNTAQLGIGSTDINIHNTFAAVTSLPLPTGTLCAVEAGGFHSLLKYNNGLLYAFGRNDYGQLGFSGTALTPKQVSVGDNIIKNASAGELHTLIVTNSDNKLYSCGYNANGQLGLNTIDTAAHSTPTLVTYWTASGWSPLISSYVSAGGSHSLVISNDNSLWVFGANNFGQLGRGDTSERTSPAPITTAVRSDGSSVTISGTVAAVSAGTGHSCIISDGILYVCGKNGAGQLGLKDITVTRFTEMHLPTERKK